MKIELKESAGSGAFGQVWRGEDDIGRIVGVKFFKPDAQWTICARDHARMLARADHPAVVDVYGLESLPHPVTSEPTEAVVLEWIDGQTLRERLDADVSVTTAITWANTLVDAVEQLHAAGIAHGDLHAENVLIDENDNLRIIDILFTESLAAIVTSDRNERKRGDLLYIRILTISILSAADSSGTLAHSFNANLGSARSLSFSDIRKSLQLLVTQAPPARDSRQIERAIARLVDNGFVDSDEYATALLDDLSPTASAEVLKAGVEQRMFRPKHGRAIRGLWRKCDRDRLAEVGNALGDEIEQTIPSGNWTSAMVATAEGGKVAWSHLPSIAQVRLISHMSANILEGHFDIYGTQYKNQSGILGTWIHRFVSHMDAEALDSLVDSFCKMLRQGWYTANYVGKYHLHGLPRLGELSGRSEDLKSAIRVALDDDSKMVKNNLSLIQDWFGMPELDDGDIEF